MDQINFDNVTISKAKPFKNINGKYCFINYQGDKLLIDLPVSTVTFDVNLSFDKPNIFINLTNPVLSSFNDNLKQTLVKLVYNAGIYTYSHDALTDFYVNPHKTAQSKKKFTDTLKLKLATPVELCRGNQIKGTLHVSGMWFSENSFGPYLNITDIEVVNTPVKSLFLEESDSEVEMV